MPEEIKLSIIIVNYKSEKLLEKCVVSIYNKPGFSDDFEVIVVNNDSNESLGSVEKSFPGVIFVNHKRNIGFGAGNNLGAKRAKGKFLLFLNPDTEILSESTENILKEFEKDEKTGVVGAGLVGSSGEVQKWSAGSEKNGWDLVKNNLGIVASKKIWSSPVRIGADWVAGTAMFVRKSLFEEIGGFDEKFFMYFEDIDFCRRAKNLGKKIVYFPDFKVLHYGGGSYLVKRSQKRDYYKSQDYYFAKHRSKFEAGIIKILRKCLYRT